MLFWLCMRACKVPAFVSLNSVRVVLQALKWLVIILFSLHFGDLFFFSNSIKCLTVIPYQVNLFTMKNEVDLHHCRIFKSDVRISIDSDIFFSNDVIYPFHPHWCRKKNKNKKKNPIKQKDIRVVISTAGWQT